MYRLGEAAITVNLGTAKFSLMSSSMTSVIVAVNRATGTLGKVALNCARPLYDGRNSLPLNQTNKIVIRH